MKKLKRYFFITFCLTLTFIISGTIIIGAEPITGHAEPSTKVYLHELFPEEGSLNRFSVMDIAADEDYLMVFGEFTMEDLRSSVEVQPTRENIFRQPGFSLIELNQRTMMRNGMPQLEFGGAFIDNDTNEYVIQFKNNDPLAGNLQDHALLVEFLGIRNEEIILYEDRQVFTVRFDEVRYSEQELNEIFEFLHPSLFNWSDNGIVGMAVDVFTNRVEINVLPEFNFNYVSSNIVDFLAENHGKHERDYYVDIITLREGSSGWRLVLRTGEPLIQQEEPFTEEENDEENNNIEEITPLSSNVITFGSRIGDNLWSVYSAGFPTRVGFITTGHGPERNGTLVFRDGNVSAATLLGEAREVRYDRDTRDGRFDSAYVPLNGNSRFNTNGFTVTWNAARLPEIGSRAAFVGMVSGSRTFTVDNNNTIWTGNSLNDIMNEVIRFSGTPARSGDSGGPFFTDSGMTRNIHGIAFASNTTFTFAIPIRNIPQR